MKQDLSAGDIEALASQIEDPKADIRLNGLRIRRQGDTLRLSQAPPPWKTVSMLCVALPLCLLAITLGVLGAIHGTELFLDLLKKSSSVWERVLIYWGYVLGLAAMSVGFVCLVFFYLDVVPRHLEINLATGEGRFRQLLRRGCRFEVKQVRLLEIVLGSDSAHLTVALNGRHRCLPIWLPAFMVRSREKALSVIEPVADRLGSLLEKPVEVTDEVTWSRTWI